MKTIWKFELKITDIQEMSMPKGSAILSVQAQNNKPYLWALVEPEESIETIIIETFGTGNPIMDSIGDPRKFVGTYQLENGAFIGHVFEYMEI